MLALGVTGYILSHERFRFPLIQSKPFPVEAEFTTAQAVIPGQGQTVRVAGVRVGDIGGVHLKSFTRDGQSTVSGTRFARWRWEAPAGTGISQVRGTWWHALHDGMEQRIGVSTWSGGFAPFASASATDTTPREFVAGFNPAQPALEDRLLCARAESKWCSLDAGSWSAGRGCTWPGSRSGASPCSSPPRRCRPSRDRA